MSPLPDLPGFRAAQDRLRQDMAEPITFLAGAVVTFPPGTPLDPETGQPYDEFLEPTASAQASAAASGIVVSNPEQDPSDATAVGILERGQVMVDLHPTASGAVAGAVHFVARGERYRVVATRDDGIAGVDRLLVFGRLE